MCVAAAGEQSVCCGALLWAACLPCLQTAAMHTESVHGAGGRAQVGGFVMIHRGDLAKLVPHWLQRTVGLRADAEAPRLAGEAASGKAGQRVK